MNLKTQLALVLPALLSLGYVIPFLGKRKLRLRDVNFIKIFLIAVVWAYVTVLLPLLELNIALDDFAIGMLVERALFIFVITLPFDLRDWEIDQRNGVQTIPAVIGVANTVRLAFIVLIVWWLLCWFLYTNPILIALGLSGLSTAFFVAIAPKQRHDYFFTALMDGTMILQYALILGIDYWC